MNRLQAPPIVDAVEFDLKLKPYDFYTLDNGINVYAINAGAQDVVMVEWVFNAGNWYEEKNIVAATTNFLLKNGTKQKNAFAINEHFEWHGAHINRHCYNETATVTLHSLSKHLHQLLPAVAEMITESIFPEEELAIYKRNQQQRLEVNLKKCDFVANRLIDEYLFGIKHPYGKYTSTLDYENLERTDLVNFFNQYYLNGNCTLFVAGKLQIDFIEQLNKHFGSLPLNKQKITPHPIAVESATEKKQHLINDANGVQGAIRIARPFPNRTHPDFAKVQVLNNIFGGFFGSRLMSNIREDKGYTYGIHSYLQNLTQQSAWMIATEAGRDVCEATIKEVYYEMEQLRNIPVDIEELNLVQNYMMGSLLGHLDGPFQIIGRWKNYILNGLNEQYFYNSIQTIKTVTPQDLQELANKYLQPQDFYELVVV
ncbi:MAG: M16 family metallopeptidase [Chitinophagaceae bacterium]